MTSFEIANQGYAYLDQIGAQHDVCTACIKIVSRQDPLAENILALLHTKHHFTPERIKGITLNLVKRLIDDAKQTEHEEFFLICRNTLVALCGGLENLVKDVVAQELLENPSFLEKLGKRQLRIPASDLLAGTDEERARLLVDTLYFEESTKNGHVEKFMRLFEYIDRKGEMEVEEKVKSAIDEAFEVRNVIVHRGSKVDKRLKDRVKNFDQEIGEFVNLRNARFQSYRSAIFAFAAKPTLWNL